jgi:hypothetical protein
VNIILNKKLPDRRYQNINVLNIILTVAVISITFIVYYYNSRDIQLKIAYKGYGPQDYVAQKLHPENFKKDFAPGLILIYDNSIPMKVYYYLAKYFGISPSKTIYPFMFLQTLLFFLSVAFLAQTLFKNNFVTSICVIVISVSNLAGLNLSRFGAGYGSLLTFPLFYGYSNAFRFFALGFFLKNKYILCFIFLALSIYCHVNMGLFGLIFIGGYLLYKPRYFRDKNLLIGMLIFVVLVIPHILSILSNSNAITSCSIPVDQWVKATKFHSHHWYPIKLGVFTDRANKVFFPFLLSIFIYFMALRYQEIKNENYIKITAGSTICIIMSLFGIIFSDIYPIPFLIKISLQRSTGLITFFGVLYLIYYLFRKMDSYNIIAIFLAIYSLLIIAFSKPGIAVLPLFILLYFDIREGHLGFLKINSVNYKIAKTIYFTAFIILLLLTLTCIFKDNSKIASSIFEYLWTPLQFFNPFHGFDFLLRGGSLKAFPSFPYLVAGASFITAVIILSHSLGRNKVFSISSTILFFAIALSALWHLESNKYLRWHNQYAKVASSYLDVQLWAKNNTANNALFMPDPTHYYGWRDFSERSSFGNLREWGYASFAYSSDYKTYVEGNKRLMEFGFDIMEENLKILIKSYVNFRKTFYTMNEEQLSELSRNYKIDYVVMNKKYHKNKFDAFTVTYENKYFIAYKF